MHTEPRAARLFLLARLSPRPGDRCRYVPIQMTEPPELANLRETLPREHALEAFRHLRGHEPDSSEQLETFIEDYIREAYSDGCLLYTSPSPRDS